MCVCWWSNCLSCGQSCLCTTCVCYSHVQWLTSEHFHSHHRYYLLLEHIFNMLKFHLFFHTAAAQLPFIPVFMSPYFSLSSFQKSPGIPFLFDLIVSQQFIASVCKSSNKTGGEKIIRVEFVSQIFNPCTKSCHSCVSCSHCGSCTFPVSALIHWYVVCTAL
jgi:hypothetical protein